MRKHIVELGGMDNTYTQTVCYRETSELLQSYFCYQGALCWFNLKQSE